MGRTFDTQNSYELQNYSSLLKGKHSWRFGVRLRGQTDDSVSPQNFNGTLRSAAGVAPVLDAQNRPAARTANAAGAVTSIERYRRTLLFQQLGYTPEQIRALGGGATQFTINAGTAELAVHQLDVGIFAGDEWRVRPNLTLNLGLRYETQTNIHDWRDLAPPTRVCVGARRRRAEARENRAARRLRHFYDRFALGNTLAARRFNGVVQQQFVVPNPDFFPTCRLASHVVGFPIRHRRQSVQAIRTISSRIRAPYIAAVRRHLGAAVAGQHHHGGDLYQLARRSPLSLGRYQRAAAGTYRPECRTAELFPRGIRGRWS